MKKNLLFLPDAINWSGSNISSNVSRLPFSQALNSFYSTFGKCPECTIEFGNNPLKSQETEYDLLKNKIIEISNKMNEINHFVGIQMELGMTVAAAYFIIFVIKENRCKSKHLQFVSGVNVCIFWLVSFLCDMGAYLLSLGFLVIVMSFCQLDGFKTSADIAKINMLLFYFGWAILPMTYFVSYFFDKVVTGYTLWVTLSLLVVIPYLYISLKMNPEGEEDLAHTLHLWFMLLPQYCLSSGLRDGQAVYIYNYCCRELLNIHRQHFNDMSTNNFFDTIVWDAKLKSRCQVWMEDIPFYVWTYPGIGKYLVFLFLTGIFYFILLCIIDGKLISKINYRLKEVFYCFVRKPRKVNDEDSDVSEEKEKLHNATKADIEENYTLAIKDLTKYYCGFLAVNGLCFGVKKNECFGLVGENGAGKTTAFKMMTGDTSISYGDGWVWILVQKSVYGKYCVKFAMEVAV